MSSKRGYDGSLTALPRNYRGAEVPLRIIRKWARQVAERFHPDKIVLFGSHAYGTPHADSDVDILVIMPCRNQHTQAFKIRMATPAPFPMDLLVRKPSEIQWRLEEGELFHTEILRRGKVLYEKGDARMGTQSRGRLPARRKARQGKRTVL
ncbi:MAG TPA: nucleotidyltransferase domain-containing protein [Gemmataceae bacterium]|nr:nucleotidyltransferase domain-containing protein [Gemmataceae bacterium]